jgi:hypothetical protein
MKSSVHSLIPSLPFILNHLPLPTLCASAPKPVSWQAGVSKLNWLKLSFCPLYNPSAWTTQKTQPLYCWEVVFIAPFQSNGSYSIVVCVFVAAWMCLSSRCLVMDVSFRFHYSGFRASCHNINDSICFFYRFIYGRRSVRMLIFKNSTKQRQLVWIPSVGAIMYHKELCEEPMGFHKTLYGSHGVGTYPIMYAFKAFHEKHHRGLCMIV